MSGSTATYSSGSFFWNLAAGDTIQIPATSGSPFYQIVSVNTAATPQTLTLATAPPAGGTWSFGGTSPVPVTLGGMSTQVNYFCSKDTSLPPAPAAVVVAAANLQ